MAWSAPPNWTNLQVVSEADLDTYLTGNTQHLYDILHGTIAEVLTMGAAVRVGLTTNLPTVATEAVTIAGNAAAGATRLALVHAISSGVGGAAIGFYQAQGTLAARTTVLNNERLGVIEWLGFEGTSNIQAARIIAEVDGTPGTNDMPGRLLFLTTADGASAVTERMRINAAGQVLISDGSLSAPSLAWLTDTNTGLQLGAADQGRLVAGANSVAVWRLDGSVVKFDVLDNLTVNTSAASALGSGVGVIALGDADTIPSTNPSGGGVIFSQAGALKWRGSSGTVTTIAAA